MAAPITIPKTLPNGSAWAAILAAGIGCAALGLTIDLAEAFKPVSNALSFYNPTGDLSGKSIVAIAVWMIAWAIFHAGWKNRKIQSPGMILAVTLVLILLGLIAAFPPVFDLFAGK